MLSACPPGLLRQALLYDLSAAINRIRVHGDETEIANLSAEQVRMYIDAFAPEPGSPEAIALASLLNPQP